MYFSFHHKFGLRTIISMLPAHQRSILFYIYIFFYTYLILSRSDVLFGRWAGFWIHLGFTHARLLLALCSISLLRSAIWRMRSAFWQRNTLQSARNSHLPYIYICIYSFPSQLDYFVVFFEYLIHWSSFFYIFFCFLLMLSFSNTPAPFITSYMVGVLHYLNILLYPVLLRDLMKF